MSLLFYRRPEYVAKNHGRMDTSDFQKYLEKQRAAIPQQLCFENVVTNRAMPVSQTKFVLHQPGRSSREKSHVRCKISWDIYFTCLTKPRASNSTYGSRITPNASSRHQEQNKHCRRRGTRTKHQRLARGGCQTQQHIESPNFNSTSTPKILFPFRPPSGNIHLSPLPPITTSPARWILPTLNRG